MGLGFVLILWYRYCCPVPLCSHLAEAEMFLHVNIQSCFLCVRICLSVCNCLFLIVPWVGLSNIIVETY